MDKGLQTDVVFMDISKAFDTVDHTRLLQKLREFGLSGSLLLWFKNCLSGRLQRVTILGATSSSYFFLLANNIKGSLLAPFLFSVYINYLPNNLTTSTGISLYARKLLYLNIVRSNFSWICIISLVSTARETNRRHRESAEKSHQIYSQPWVCHQRFVHS